MGADTEDDHHSESAMSSETAGPSSSAMAARSHMDMDPQEVDNIVRIASHLSRRHENIHPGSTTDGETLNEDDPALDPSAKEFDLRKYLTKVLRDFSREGIEASHAGIVFKDLTISGSGAALQFQSTVASMMSLPSQVKDLWRERNSPAKQILHDFNGTLKSGELLLVLGRPGAGCSTFLKSLCGELHGLTLDDKSVVHYNGNIYQPYSSHSDSVNSIDRRPTKTNDEGIQGRSRVQPRGMTTQALFLKVPTRY